MTLFIIQFAAVTVVIVYICTLNYIHESCNVPAAGL